MDSRGGLNMTRCNYAVLLPVLAAACLTDIGVSAQPLTLPPMEACRRGTGASGLTGGIWESRRDAQHSGQFRVTMDLSCDDDTSHVRVSNLEIHAQELADSDPSIDRVISVDHDGVVQLFSIGQAMTPTVFVSGPCLGGGRNGCQFWLMLVDNGRDRSKGSHLVAFLVTDKSGKRLAYGAGPVLEGDLSITTGR
jgi:hypothetical protein